MPSFALVFLLDSFRPLFETSSFLLKLVLHSPHSKMYKETEKNEIQEDPAQ